MTLAEAYAELNITTDFIPYGSSNRPGTSIKPQYITIHETDNPGKGADAIAHAKYLKGLDARKRKVSWHYTVDSVRCVKHLPLSEKGFHAGTGEGNRTSIGIEICVNSDGDFEKAKNRAALLAAVLCQSFDFTPGAAVVQHNRWSGKNCPSTIRSQHGHWDDFKAAVRKFDDELE